MTLNPGKQRNEVSQVRVGPLVMTVRHTDDYYGRELQKSIRPFQTQEVSAELDLDFLTAGDERLSRTFYEHRAEVQLSADHELSSFHVSLSMTPRSMGRAIKHIANSSYWHYSRYRLAYRYGFEHPLTASLEKRYAILTLHGAAVQKRGQAIVLLGSNGAGKTSAAVQLVERYGCSLLADNFIITDGNQVYAFPGRARIKGQNGSVLRPTETLEPRPQRAKIASVLHLRPRTGVPEQEPFVALRKYYQGETEDHRSSGLGRLLASDPEILRRRISILQSLSEARWDIHDWRRDSLATSVGDIL